MHKIAHSAQIYQEDKKLGFNTCRQMQNVASLAKTQLESACGACGNLLLQVY